MPKEHRCQQCHKKFPHASTLQRHLETHMITGDWMCGLCNSLFNRLSALNHHWQNSCPEFKMVFCDDDIKKMSCDDLREAAFRLTLDRYSVEGDIQQPGPSNRIHEYKRTMSSVCIYCNILVPRGTLNHHFGVHMNRHGPEELCPNSIIRYVCDLCGYGFRFKNSLFVHWRTKCAEVSANCPPEGMVISNGELIKMVQDLVQRAEVEKPYATMMNHREEEEEKTFEKDDEDEETKSSFIAQITPVAVCSLHVWNTTNKLEHSQCAECNRKFHSIARLENHVQQFHENKKYIFCELCQTKFTQTRALMNHLRGSCKAMRVEEPDDAKRKKLTNEEIEMIIDNARGRWNSLFENKKAENLKFINEYLENIDKQLVRNIVDVPILQVPMTYVAESNSQSFCESCGLYFSSDRILYQHQQVAHSSQIIIPRNQIIITTSSLLSCIKLPEASFYDINGREYHIGKYLEKGKEFAKHLKNRIVDSGTIIRKIDENENFVVELFGGDGQHILFNEFEFPEVCDNNGMVKTLFMKNPKLFDDIPVLHREV